jgi:acyl-CoA thioester hydrolase
MDHEKLRDFPVIIELPVLWGDMDAFQHVNNVRYFRYFESARIAYCDRVGLSEIMEKTGVGPILSFTQCRFRIALTYPDMISIGARVSEIGKDRFTMKTVLISHRFSKVAAEGEDILVTYDYKVKRKTPLPAELRQNILALEGNAGKGLEEPETGSR